MKYTILLFLILLSLSLQGQKLTEKQIAEDLIQLKEAIQDYNPALSTYNPNFISQADSLIGEVSGKAVSPIDGYTYISQLCALSNEGHFSVGTWEDAVHAGFIDNEYRYLPISVKVLQGKLMVWLDNSMEQSLNRGDEILSIHGLTAKEIFEKMYQAFPADGRITTYVDRNIERGFSWMFYLFVERPDTFQMEIKDSSGLITKRPIQALTRKVQFAHYAKFYPDRAKGNGEQDAFYTLTHTGETSYLTLPSFDFRRIEKFDVKSKQLYKAIFGELKEKKIKNLVIDLRGNTGGRNEFGDDMVPFILKKRVEAPFLKKTISWDGKTRTYAFPKPSKLAFTGNIFVLVDGRTYSAGSTLARYLHEYGQATIIGEETGTRYEGFAAGSQHVITLNHSQTRIGIPRYHIVFPASEKQSTSNRGLLPQHTIEYTIEDIRQKKDLHVEKAASLIRKK